MRSILKSSIKYTPTYFKEKETIEHIEERKAKAKYFKNVMFDKAPSTAKIDVVRRIVEGAIESLPQEMREYVEEDKANTIERTVHMIMGERYEDTDKVLHPYAMLRAQALSGLKRRDEYFGTKRELWKFFIGETPDVYNRYRTYMYRKGENPRAYFFKNVNIEATARYTDAYLELPLFGKYESLTMRIDQSFTAFSAKLNKNVDEFAEK